MGPHHEKTINRLIYPTLIFSALTTRLWSVSPSFSRSALYYQSEVFVCESVMTGLRHIVLHRGRLAFTEEL